jgi:hypothetical protein
MTVRSLLRAYVLLLSAAGVAFSCSLNPQPVPPGENPTSSLGSNPPTTARDGGLGVATISDASAPTVDATTFNAADGAAPAGPANNDDASDGSPLPLQDAGDASDGPMSPSSEDAGGLSDGQSPASEDDAATSEGQASEAGDEVEDEVR